MMQLQLLARAEIEPGRASANGTPFRVLCLPLIKHSF